MAGYRVYRNGSGTPLATVAGTSYSDTGLTANTAYTYRVSAYDAAGNESDLSSPPAVRDDAGQPAARRHQSDPAGRPRRQRRELEPD